jgi:hypothetical protein
VLRQLTRVGSTDFFHLFFNEGMTNLAHFRLSASCRPDFRDNHTRAEIKKHRSARMHFEHFEPHERTNKRRINNFTMLIY